MTDSGRLYAARVLNSADAPTWDRDSEIESQPALCPHWDAALRVLYVGSRVIKRYRVPSPTQEAILVAFEEEGWPQRIDDPLPPQPGQDAKCRLHDAIKRLNRHHQHGLLRFFGDGTGEGVCWKPADVAAIAIAFNVEQTNSLRRAA